MDIAARPAQVELFFLPFSDVTLTVLIVKHPVIHIRVLSILFLQSQLMWRCDNIVV